LELLFDAVGDDPVDLVRVVVGVFGLAPVHPALVRLLPEADDLAGEGDALLLGVDRVVAGAGDARLHVGAAEFVGGHLFPGRRFVQRRGGGGEESPRGGGGPGSPRRTGWGGGPPPPCRGRARRRAAGSRRRSAG